MSILGWIDGPREVVGEVWERLRGAERVFLRSTLVQEARDLTWEECFVVGWQRKLLFLLGLLAWV